MTKTSIPPRLIGRHRCEHLEPAREGDLFRCYCGRSWELTRRPGPGVATSRAVRWVQTGGPA